jgi:hypothetical protein
MAESGEVSGILGADAEPPSESTATFLDPTAAALAAEAAKCDPELAKEASAYFRKQSHLIEVQTEHLHEQRAVNLSLLKLKRFDERLKVGLRVFVILAASAIGLGLIEMFRDRHDFAIAHEMTPDVRNWRGHDADVCALHVTSYGSQFRTSHLLGHRIAS